MKNIKYIFAILIASFIFQSCGDMDIFPEDQLTTGSISNSSDGILNVTNGNYALLKDGAEFNGIVDDNNCYLRQYFQMSDFAADDIVCGQKTEDPLYYSFTYTHSPNQSNSRFFWYISYKIINGANTVIQYLESKGDLTDEEKQLLGENYFLRAFVEFNLVKFYAFPYNQGDPNSNLGIILRTSTSEPAEKARATVQETYDQLLQDALQSADLMNKPRGKEFASKEAAWALLSRVYLYMEDYNKSIEYADKVIDSGRFTLETGESYPSYFANALSRGETIWAIAFTPSDNRGKFGSIASMMYSDGNSGWGEEFATYDYMDLLHKYPGDVRATYIDTVFKEPGVVQKKNGLEVFFITKFSFQDGDPNLSSPVMFRLGEMYLNKAEAYAHLANESEALANVNIIRENRGLSEHLINLVPNGKTILGVVLDERRAELAFEGHRYFDLTRNKMDVDRTYWGYHIKGLTIGDIDLSKKPSGYDNLVIKWDDPAKLYFIPIDEMIANSQCIQN